MDYSAILQELNKASLFDLHRLESAINQELSNPARLDQIKARLKTGQLISYFDPQSNSLIDAVILHILAQPEHPFCSNLNTYSETS